MIIDHSSTEQNNKQSSDSVDNVIHQLETAIAIAIAIDCLTAHLPDTTAPVTYQPYSAASATHQPDTVNHAISQPEAAASCHLSLVRRPCPPR
ncbi:hypothetical protein E2C01_032317 [Portunus trituberculatus]|uniref:Uncharacterized protein n=1 Tax=Portunus trituberculatus TaxID=210409 RepID=A0A5B7EVP6_PORTR|nr:hypothetical protein [Portunus trituberculatus]